MHKACGNITFCNRVPAQGVLPTSGFASWLPWRSYFVCAPRRAWGCDVLNFQHLPRVERLEVSCCPSLCFRRILILQDPHCQSTTFFMSCNPCAGMGTIIFILKARCSFRPTISNTRTRFLHGRAMISRLQIENYQFLYKN